MKRSESPLFFLLALWVICIGLVALFWWALMAFLARNHG